MKQSHRVEHDEEFPKQGNSITTKGEPDKKRVADRKLQVQHSDVSSYSMNPAEPGLPEDFMDPDSSGETSTASLPAEKQTQMETRESEEYGAEESQSKTSIKDEGSDTETFSKDSIGEEAEATDSECGTESFSKTDSDTHNFGSKFDAEFSRTDLRTSAETPGQLRHQIGLAVNSHEYTMKRERKVKASKAVEEKEVQKWKDPVPKLIAAKSKHKRNIEPPKKGATEEAPSSSWERLQGKVNPVEKKTPKAKTPRKTAWEKEYYALIEELDKIPTVHNKTIGAWELNYESQEFDLLRSKGKIEKYQKLKTMKQTKCEKEGVEFKEWMPGHNENKDHKDNAMKSEEGVLKKARPSKK